MASLLAQQLTQLNKNYRPTVWTYLNSERLIRTTRIIADIQKTLDGNICFLRGVTIVTDGQIHQLGVKKGFKEIWHTPSVWTNWRAERQPILEERENVKERHYVWGSSQSHIYQEEVCVKFSTLICDQCLQSMFGTVTAELAQRLLIGWCLVRALTWKVTPMTSVKTATVNLKQAEKTNAYTSNLTVTSW